MCQYPLNRKLTDKEKCYLNFSPFLVIGLNTKRYYLGTCNIFLGKPFFLSFLSQLFMHWECRVGGENIIRLILMTSTNRYHHLRGLLPSKPPPWRGRHRPRHLLYLLPVLTHLFPFCTVYHAHPTPLQTTPPVNTFCHRPWYIGGNISR